MAGQPTPPDEPRRRRPLTRAEILEAALALIDERGLDGLSMRALGARLGVEAMALYRHVAGKRGVLEGVADMLLAQLSAGPPPSGGWREVLAGYARHHRRLVRAHPHAVTLLSGRPERSYVAARDAGEALLRHLCRCGFGEEDAVRAVRLVNRCVIGFSLDERPAGDEAGEAGAGAGLPDDGYPLLRALLADMARPDRGDEDLFEFGIEVMLDGLERRLGPRVAG